MAHFLAPEAAGDLDEIWSYIAGHSNTETADRIIDRITEIFLLLAAHPYAGRARDHDLREGYRSFPVGNYLVLYGVEGRHVRILRVVHGSRDLDTLV